MEIFQIGRTTLYRWFHKGLPYVKINGRVYCLKADLENFVAEHRIIEDGGREYSENNQKYTMEDVERELRV